MSYKLILSKDISQITIIQESIGLKSQINLEVKQMADEIIVVSAADSNEVFAFKSEKGFFRWMKNTEHVFAEDGKAGKQDRGIVTSKTGDKVVSYESKLFSAKDPIDIMPK